MPSDLTPWKLTLGSTQQTRCTCSCIQGRRKQIVWRGREIWKATTVFPHIRPAGIIFSLGLQLRVLLEITKFHLNKSVPGAGIIRNAGIIRGRALYEGIQLVSVSDKDLPVHRPKIAVVGSAVVKTL